VHHNTKCSYSFVVEVRSSFMHQICGLSVLLLRLPMSIMLPSIWGWSDFAIRINTLCLWSEKMWKIKKSKFWILNFVSYFPIKTRSSLILIHIHCNMHHVCFFCSMKLFFSICSTHFSNWHGFFFTKKNWEEVCMFWEQSFHRQTIHTNTHHPLSWE
jgi:hypothetical protein